MRMLAPMNSPIWPPMSPARVGGAGTGRSVVSGHRGSSRAYWDRGRQVIFAKRLTAFVQKEHKAILVGFLFSSLCFSAFFYFSKANRYYSENIKYPNIHSLGKFSQAYEIVPHSCPQACLFHFALSEGSAPSSHYIPRQQSLGKALGGGGGGRGGRNLWDRGGQPALGGRLSYHAHGMGRGQCHEQLTQEPCNFIGLLLLNSLIVEDFKENVQHQDVLPVKGLGEEVQVTSLSLTGGDLSKLPSLNLSLHP